MKSLVFFILKLIFFSVDSPNHVKAMIPGMPLNDNKKFNEFQSWKVFRSMLENWYSEAAN